MISVDELRAAGALDVPPAWRKSLGTERDTRQRTLFSGLCDEDEVQVDERQSDPGDSDGADSKVLN